MQYWSQSIFLIWAAFDVSYTPSHTAHALTHTCTKRHWHSHAHTCIDTHSRMQACQSFSYFQTRSGYSSFFLSFTHAHTHPRAHTNEHTHTRTHTHTHTLFHSGVCGNNLVVHFQMVFHHWDTVVIISIFCLVARNSCVFCSLWQIGWTQITETQKVLTEKLFNSSTIF